MDWNRKRKEGWPGLVVEPLDAWVILAPRPPWHKNRPGRDFANCKMSFMHAHSDRCQEGGDKTAEVTRKTSRSRQASSTVISLFLEN